MIPGRPVSSALILAALVLGLAACGDTSGPQAPRSLVGDHAAPGVYALAGDTITVWKRIERPGARRLHAYSIAPGGTVEFLDEPERGAATDVEEAPAAGETRIAFALPPREFEAIRAKAALLRPGAMGPQDPVGGFAGEVAPAGCSAIKDQPRLAGINFINSANWGAFVLQAGCGGGNAALAAFDQVFASLERARGAAGR